MPLVVKAAKGPFSGHIPALDGVRGLAIFLVFLVHFFEPFTAQNPFEKCVFFIAGYGGLGVDLFFVLSGFLITGILCDTKAGPNFFKNFYMRRFFRIFPLYYGVLLVLFGVLPFIPAFQGETLTRLSSIQGWAWSYLLNVYVALQGAWTHPYITHFWSLSVEEHFYIFWPLVVYSCSRKNLLRICVGLMVFSCVLRMILYASGVNFISIYALTPCRLDGLALGAYLAASVRGEGSSSYWTGWLKSRARVLAIGTIVFFLLAYAIEKLWGDIRPLVRPLRESCYVLMFASLLVAALISPKQSLLGRFFNAKFCCFLGKYSYGLYMFHAMIAVYMRNVGFHDLLARYIPVRELVILIYVSSGIFGSIVAAYLSYNLYEKHFLALKARWDYKH